MTSSPDTPQFRYPFDLSEVEQDSLDDVMGMAEIILRYPEGFLEHLPSFGTRDLALRENTEGVLQDVRSALLRWGGDSMESLVEERGSDLDSMLRHLIVTVGKRASDA